MTRARHTLLALVILQVMCVYAQRSQMGGQSQFSGKSFLQANSQIPFQITTGSLPSGTLNQPGYTAQINAANGIPPYTCALTSGSLPGGLQLVGCSIIGTPTAPAGVFTFTITATDAATPTAHTATAMFTINIGCPAISILTPSGSIPAGQEGTAYGPFQFQNLGGIAPFTWSQSSGTLCSGLTLSSSGSLSGTPTVQQVCTFGVMVADSCNIGTQTASALFQQQINTNIAITTPPTLPPATAGVAYTQSLHEAGGTAPYIWSTTSTLPGTFTLTSAGVLSGTVTIVGTYTINVTVTDSLNATATAASPTISDGTVVSFSCSGSTCKLNYLAAGTATVQWTFTLKSGTPYSGGPIVLPADTVNVSPLSIASGSVSYGPPG